MRASVIVSITGAVVFAILAFNIDRSISGDPTSNKIGSCEMLVKSNGGIVLSHADPEARIYYSVNGTDPMLDGMLYQDEVDPNSILINSEQAYVRTGIKWRRPISVDQGLAIIRCRAYSSNNVWGPGSAFAIPARDMGSLPVVSIITDAAGLFDPDTGIYNTGNAFLFGSDSQKKNYANNDAWWIYPGNYSERGKAWEREAYFHYFESDGEQTVSSSIGLRINGNFTRAFADRSMRVLFNRPIRHSFFQKIGYHEYAALILRNSGNDRHRSKIRDAVMAEVASELDLEVQAYEPVSLYVNGVYWGLFNLRERQDDKYIANRLQVDRKAIAILEDEGLIYRGSERDSIDLFKALRKTENADLNDPAEYDKVSESFDLNNFMDHMACELYFANQDWPLQNVKIWRHTSTENVSTPWRWMLNDMDLAMGYQGPWHVDLDMFAHIRSKAGPTARLFNALMRTAKFRESFRMRLEELLATSFSTEEVLETVDLFSSRIATEMPRHIDRWRYPSSIKFWKSEVETLRDFSRKRPAIMREHMIEHLEKADA